MPLWTTRENTGTFSAGLLDPRGGAEANPVEDLLSVPRGTRRGQDPSPPLRGLGDCDPRRHSALQSNGSREAVGLAQSTEILESSLQVCHVAHLHSGCRAVGVKELGEPLCGGLIEDD